MERKSGMAAIAVLVAVLGFSFVPRRGGESGAPAEPQKRAQPVRRVGVAKAAPPKVRPACEEISQRISRFYTGDIHHPPSCYEGETKDDGVSVANANQTPKFAIALVPNPAQTNLPVVFDRLIEVIQQAAQDENYSYDGSWFPWSEEKSYDRFGDEEKAEEQQSELQQQPGVLTFRRNVAAKDASGTDAGTATGKGDSVAGKSRSAADNLGASVKNGSGGKAPGPYDGGLVVFVVGEQPTGGIDDEQFGNAMEWLKKLGGDPAKNGLHILGPTFSGSLPSLERELDNSDVPLSNVTVYSGTANSNESVDRFKQFICGTESKLPTGCRRFRTFLESDSLMTHRFLQFINQSCYHVERVAILSEDETAFGAESARAPNPAAVSTADRTQPAAGAKTKATTPVAGEDNDDKECKKANAVDLDNLPIYLYYPRDIANLRTAYSKQSIFSQGQQANNTPSSTLRGDPGEAAGSRHDTVQTYAGELTPYAQEATLFGIVNVLQAKHIQFVLVRSSNSLDQLFLSEFLRRSYPSGRVVLDGADLLFRRGVQGNSLRGVMVLSTYPLLAWTHDQVRPVQFADDNYKVAGVPTTSYRIFGDELSEGVYIAARGLLVDKAGENPRGISDYGPPRAVLSSPAGDQPDDLRPATWLTVVGHRQFWPIAVLNDKTIKLEGTPDPTEGKAALLLSALAPDSEPKIESNPAGTQQAPTNPMKDMNAKPGPPFPADTTALMLFCCVLAVVHFLLCWKGRMIGAPRVRAYFAPIPLAQQPVLVFIGSLLLGWLAVTLGGVTSLFEEFYAGQHALWTGHQAVFLWGGLAVLVLCGLFGFLANYRLPLLHATVEEKRQASSSQRPAARAVAASAAQSAAGGVVTTLVSDEGAADRQVESSPSLRGGNIGQDEAATLIPEKAKVSRSGFKYFWKLLLEKIRNVRDLLANRNVPWWLLAGFWLATLAAMVAGRLHLNSRLTDATRMSAFWRNSHITNGVSGLLPQVLLIVGFYAWFWYNLRGLSLFGEDRPVLPGRDSLPECFHRPDKTVYFESQDDRRDRKLPSDPSGAQLFSMFSAEQAGASIEEAAHPLNWFYLWTYPFILIATVGLCFLTLGEQVLQTLGDRAFGRLIFFAMSVAIALVLADTLQFARTWGRLHQLLVFLDRLRLRRTLACLKGLSWKSVLSMSSNVLEERYCLISRQLESARNLQTTLEDWKPGDAVDEEHKKKAIEELIKCEAAGLQFAERYTLALSDPSSHNVGELKRDLMSYQQGVAKTAGCVMTHILVPAWRRERQSLLLDAQPVDKAEDDKGGPKAPLATDDHVRAAEEFFVLPYVGFIQNIMGRVRTIAIAILLLFTATTLALSSYPFSPTPALGAICLAVFVLVGAMVVFVYAEMHCDATLSHITQTRPGQLGFEFWSRIVSFGIGPLIGLLTTLFPSVTDFVVSWLQPGAETVK